MSLRKGCLFSWVYGWMEKVYTAWEKVVLYQLKFGRYYRCRLHVCKKGFEIKHLGEYQDLSLKSDTLLLANFS